MSTPESEPGSTPVTSTTTTADISTEPQRGDGLRFVLFALVIGSLLAAAWYFDAKTHLVTLLSSIKDLGALGGLALSGIYVLATVFMMPGSVLTLGGGAIYGVLWGWVYVYIGANLGSWAAFLAGRTLARGWISSRVEGNARFKAIDEAVAREGFKIVLLTRLSPVFPFNLLNYGLGLTNVKFWHYAAATFIGMLPGSLMYVYLGSVFGLALQDRAEQTTEQKVLFWVGLGITVIVTLLVTRIAKKALNQAADLEEATDA